MISAILSAVSGFFSVIKGVLDRWFPALSEAEKERDRIKEVNEESKTSALERNEAIKNARVGKTSLLERIINRK